jgi:hypothetical protein
MPAIDEREIEYEVYNGRSYYNRSNSAKYVGMTYAGLSRKIDMLKKQKGIAVPFITLPSSMQSKYCDKRILDVLKKSFIIGKEQEWYDELRRVVEEVARGE